MPATSVLDGIVLRTHDIGEADRLCIIFTRERGRMAVRARGVRKTGSRMGPLLLPGRSLTLEVQEHSGGDSIVSARAHEDPIDLSNPHALSVAQEGIELLLLLTEDGAELPGVYELLQQFLPLCSGAADRAFLPFALRLFHLLGLLPSHEDDPRYAELPASAQAAVRACATESDFHHLLAVIPADRELHAFLRSLLQEHLTRELRSSNVGASLKSL